MGTRTRTRRPSGSPRRTIIGAVLSLVLLLAIMASAIYLQRRPATHGHQAEDQNPRPEPVSAVDKTMAHRNTLRAASV